MFFAGTALQLFIGEVPSALLAHPWGAVLAINYLYIVILLSFYKERWKWVASFTGRPSYMASLASMLVLTLIFGLIPQDGATTGVLGVLGLTNMKSSWIFNIFLLHFTTLTGVKAIDDIRNIKKGRLPSKIIHAAFFTILTAAIFGSGDKTKIDITAIQGYPVGIGIDDKGARAELPFSIRLKEFTLDEYPPQIKIVSGGAPSKEYMTIEGEKSNGKIGQWQIECTQYIDMAGRKPNDSAYIEMNHVGATTAAYIKATDGKQSAEGWVSCGSHIFAAATLPLPNGEELIMPRREIKKFLSKIEIERDGEKQTYDIAVNKAFTSVALKMSTATLKPLAQPGASLYGIQFTNNSKIVVFGGGDMLTNAKGEIVGGLGVSGGSEEQDTALSAFGKEYFEKQM